ncbi:MULTISPECIES: fimbrial protein [Pseudomonas aeruginosa group]
MLQGPGPTDPSYIRALPATTALKAVPIGGVLASHEFLSTTQAIWRCPPGETMTFGMGPLTTSLKPIDSAQGLYESGVKGVGIRIRFKPRWGGSVWSAYMVPPFEYRTTASLNDAEFPHITLVEFIRTGMEVGRGAIPPFDVTTSHFRSDNAGRVNVAILGTQLKTTLTQNIYFTSCHNPSSDPTVDMGHPYAALVKQGQVEEHTFSLTIRCEGMNSTTKPPVKIYFEGNAVRDGLLRLSGDGQAGVARGVGIELKNDRGVALPFAKERALPLAWRDSAPDAEIYGFAGKAKYVATESEIKAGKADAVLTYVLEYN